MAKVPVTPFRRIAAALARRVGLEVVDPAHAASATPTAAATPSAAPSGPGGAIYTRVFDYDGLRTDPAVIHNHDFMRDPRYANAYRKGLAALGHDHPMFWRLHVALWCASHAQRLPGDFVECGVWRGFLSTAIMHYLDWGALDKRFVLFDTFEGLDERYLTDAERANTQKLDHFKPYYTGVWGFVSEHFKKYERVVLVRGAVPETLPTVDIPRVSFLSIDMNCALPEIAAAEWFWERLSPGAPVLLDDYGFVSYEEQKARFDDFALRKGVPILALPTGQGLIIKP